MNGKRLAAALCALAIVGASAGGLPLDGLDDLAITAVAGNPNTDFDGEKFDGSASTGTGGTGLTPGSPSVAKASIDEATVNLDPDTHEVVSITIYDEVTIEGTELASNFDITYGTEESHTAESVPTVAGTYYAYVKATDGNTKYTGECRSEAFQVSNPTGTFDDGKGTWEFDTKTGTLNLRPTGTETAAIPVDFAALLRDVYKIKREDIKTVVIKDGITGIGNYAFADCSNLKSVTIADSVTRIGYCAFVGCSGLETVTFQRPASAGETTPSLTIERGVFYNAPDAAVVNYAGEGNLQLYYTENNTKEFISKVSQINLALNAPNGSVLLLGWADPDQSPSTSDPTYTVTIPSDLTINPVTVNGVTTYKGRAVVSAEYANLGTKRLRVEVTSANGYKLVEVGEDGQPKSGGYAMPYTLTSFESGGNPINENQKVVFETTVSTEKTDVPLNIEVVNPEKVYAGTYTDTLTFSISLRESGS